MSAARHHTEWMSLLEISGPFLSMNVLEEIFPQGLDDDVDAEKRRKLRQAYEEWKDSQMGLRANPAIHRAWVRYVLVDVLEMPGDVLAEGSQLAPELSLTVAEYQETVRPDLAIVDPEDGRARLLIQALPLGQKLEANLAGHHWKASPATRMMELLHAADVPLGLVTNGEQWMLVHAPRNETTGFVTWEAGLWLEEPLTLAAWRSLLGVRRFFGVPDDETLEAMLRRSKDSQHEVAKQLGYQLRRAVEVLVRAIDLADRDAGHNLLAEVSESELYEAAVTFMMRLVFLFAAEEQGLFPLDDEFYSRHYAASPLRDLLREAADRYGEEVIERRADAYCRLLATFRAIYGGIDHDRLRLPAYGGGLFDPDKFPFLEGRAAGTSWINTRARPLPINNRTLLHVLEALQLLQVRTPGGERQARRLSFRALDIEQIGDVYERLLDHTARRATEPVLGLTGTRDREPEVPLATLEELRAKGEKPLLDFLKQATGRSSVNPIRTALGTPPDLVWSAKLQAACGNDETLYQRIAPFAGLIRADDLGQPVVILPGSVYVTEGQERRASGTHYTPRSLTEPIVQHTLEPLVYRGPAEGKPREQWKLRSAAELLRLKICDMAMGSGAFLVQVCRYLAARLVEAWEEAEQATAAGGRGVYVTVEGKPTRTLDEAIPTGSEERMVLARRLVAERCLYGVDKNPLAVEMAKLSLWLITLDQGRAFSFLDHALKCGDSLVGIDSLDQLRTWSLDGSGDRHFSTLGIDLDIQKLIERRRQIEEFSTRDIADQQIKAYMLADADAITHDLRRAADMLVASYYNTLPKAQQETLREALLLAVRDGASVEERWWQHADLGGLQPFHWPLEFPEVFLAEGRSGFDAFVGNPPFIGGQRIRGAMGGEYLQYLKTRWDHAKGSADYCTYFFLRAFENLRSRGTLGLIATNTIAQGDTRELGLERICERGGDIYRASKDYPWPGQAAVVVNVVHATKGTYLGEHILDDKPVRRITPLLDDMETLGRPYRLASNAGKSFQGSNLWGIGFALSPDEAHDLLNRDPKYQDVIFPYLNGEDLNQRPDQSPSRWVINFFDWPLERAELYPDAMLIVRERVKPGREMINRERNREYWWLYGENRPGLYETIAPLQRLLIIAQTSKTLAFTFVPKGIVYSHMTVVIASQDDTWFALLQSSLHISWILGHASSLKGDARYIPSDCFENFPFPGDLLSLSLIGETYHEYRRQLMLDRWEGLTATYNRFHDPGESAADIARLRELHVEMDNAVAAAYGWHDLDLGHGFHETAQGIRYTIHEAARREVLTRLLALNHERYAEEVAAGLHDKKKGKGKAGGKRRGKSAPNEQMELL